LAHIGHQFDCFNSELAVNSSIYKGLYAIIYLGLTQNIFNNQALPNPFTQTLPRLQSIITAANDSLPTFAPLTERPTKKPGTARSCPG